MANNECCVCLTNIDSHKYKLKCEHEFHTQCIMKWFETGNICPLCREEIISDHESNRYYMSEDSSDNEPVQLLIKCWYCKLRIISRDLIKVNVNSRVKPVHQQCWISRLENSNLPEHPLTEEYRI